MATINVGPIVGIRRQGAPALGTPPLALGPMIGARFVGGPRLPAVPGATDITTDIMDPADPGVVLAPLVGAYGRSWVDTPSDAGNAALTLGNENPQVADIAEGSLVRMSLNGLPAVTMVCEVVDSTLIGGGEGAEKEAEETRWTGRLHGTLTEAGVWYPARGVRTLPIQENRTCDYTDSSYDDSLWGSPIGFGDVEQIRVYYFYFAGWWSDLIRLFINSPDDIGRGFPDPFAKCLWAPGGTLSRGRPLPADAGGDIWGRRTIVIPNTGTYHGFGFAFVHNAFDVFVDGVLWFSSSGLSGNGETGDGQIDLSAGPHELAFHVHCLNDAQVTWVLNPSGAFNPGLFAYSIFRADNVNVTGFIAHSDGTEKLVSYVPQPGMTPGRAWRLFSDEAEARGVLMPARGFTDLVDSNGNPWTTPVISSRVGTDGFTFLREMSATYVDWKMRVGSFTLDMWAKGTAGVDRTTGLHGPTDPSDQTTTTLQRLLKKGQAS